jgi:hypothetical protein
MGAAEGEGADCGASAFSEETVAAGVKLAPDGGVARRATDSMWWIIMLA